MRVKRARPDDPLEWLNRARSNLARAKARIPEVYLEDLCFDAQQAAEKAIKAVLIAKKARFPYVHDITRLLTFLEESGVPVPKAIMDAEELTPYAVAMRYPSSIEPVTEKHYKRALKLTERVVGWAEKQVAGR